MKPANQSIMQGPLLLRHVPFYIFYLFVCYVRIFVFTVAPGCAYVAGADWLAGGGELLAVVNESRMHQGDGGITGTRPFLWPCLLVCC